MITKPTVDLRFLKDHRALALKEVEYPIFRADYINGGGVIWEAMDYFFHLSGNANNPLNKLSQGSFVNYCYELNVWIDFVDLQIAKGHWNGNGLWSATDLTLERFVEYLRETPSSQGVPRGNNAIRTLVQRVVNFYKTCTSVLKIAPKSMCGNIDDGDRYNINYTFKEDGYVDNKGRKIKKISIDHYAKPLSEPGRGREPISDDEIFLWSEAVDSYSNTPFVVERWEHIEILLEFTGGRVSEIATINASQILQSEDAGTSDVVLTTSKGSKKGQKRTLSIPKNEFDVLYNFAKYKRPELINEAIESGAIKKDHDHLIIKANGEPMSGRSFTNHIGNVLRTAGVKRVNAHKFRHRFITINLANQLTKVMSENRFNDQTYTTAVNELKKLTLHASKTAIEEYISLAFLYMGKNSENEQSTQNEIRQFGELCISLLEEKVRGNEGTKKEIQALNEVLTEVKSLLNERGVRGI